MKNTSPAPRPPKGGAEETPANVAKLATQEDVLPLGELALIGTFGTEEKPGALLFLPQGRAIRAQVGDRTVAGKVVGIDQGSVTLQRRGKTVRLSMPG
ncbi:MAG: pilus assembly protein PilP [Rhodobacteraceae bacterium]|nr:pilus assembly protein PilP [Paracoccaceae bacterium]